MNLKFVATFIISSIAYANSQACTTSQKSSCGTFTAFNFNILNDVNEAYQSYWVNFSGNLFFYNNIANGATIGMNCKSNSYTFRSFNPHSNHSNRSNSYKKYLIFSF
jgi:hypothetical protein